MVPVQLAALVVDEQSLAQQVRLGEVGGSREVAIMIGMFEALAIQRALGEARSERPLTHKLLLDVIQALGASLERVEVDGVERDPQGVGCPACVARPFDPSQLPASWGG